MEEKGYTDENTIIEISSVTEDTLYDEDKVETDVELIEDELKVIPKKSKKKVKKPKKKSWWSNLEKKYKILIIVGIVLILLLVIGILLYFLVFKKEDKKTLPPEENVVIEKDNYIYENGKLKLLGSDEEVIGIYECTDKDVDKCYVAPLSNEDEFDLPKYVDEDDNLIEKKSKIYNKRFVFIYDEEKIMLYDIDKETKTGEYSLIKTGGIDEDLVVVKDLEDNYGLIEFALTDASVALEFEYEYLGIISNPEVFVAKEGSYSYLVNIDGEIKSSKIRGDIKNFSSKYIAVYEDNYNLYDYSGQKVLEDDYDYIDFADKYTFVIDNKKIFAYDEALVKLNESGIKVKSDEYTKIYVFDEDNNLKETKKAYTITFTKDAITFELSDESVKAINLNEVAINKTLSYVNYLDGKLYFYSDADKTELLGSYDCTNKNEVTSSEDEYTNCMIAKDSNLINNNEMLGYIPIINENYVFIRDTKNGSTKENIVLYDLDNSSQKVKYQAVDTGISAEEINHVSSVNGAIAAKNNDGNVGIITFGENGPAGLIAFKDDNNGGATKKISYFKDYFLVERDNGNYLYNKIGGDPVAQSKFTIKDYRNGYLLVKDSEYHVYDNNTGAIISNGFDHVELFDDFFVGVDGKNLNVYAYDDAKQSLIEEDLIITENNIAKGYKLSIYSDAYVISIYAGQDASVDYKYSLIDWSKVE